MKSLNRSLILNTIRSKGPISRADIAKQTKLTPPSITNIVNELLETNLIKESETGVSKGGRRPILLTINWTSHYVIGIDIGVHKIRFVLTDLKADIVEKAYVKLPSRLTETELVRILKENISEMMKQSNIPVSKMIGIGIGMHGIVDSEKGVSLYAPTLNLKHIPLKAELQEEFQLPVKVENDAKTLALGEKWFGQGFDTENLVSINVGRGIGAGIILNNQIYHGDDHIAGEIGHIVIDIDGPKCSCGNYGCLQTMAGGTALTEYVLKEIALGRKTTILDEAEGKLEKINGEIIYEAALKKDSLALEAFEKNGRYLGIGVANLIHFMNPSLIVIGGGVSKAGNLLLDPVRNLVKQRGLTDGAKDTQIVASKLGEHGTAIGAITLILADLFALELQREH